MNLNPCRDMYEANAAKLEGVMSLLARFAPFQHVAKLAKLKGSVDAIAASLCSQLLTDFKVGWTFIDPLQNLPLRDNASFEEKERVRAARAQVGAGGRAAGVSVG